MAPANRDEHQEARLSVRCIVSDRWLSFPTKAGTRLDCGEPLVIRVMTRGRDDRPHQICEPIVTREDLLDTLGQVPKAAGQACSDQGLRSEIGCSRFKAPTVAPIAAKRQ
jgi:hypothetical protein